MDYRIEDLPKSDRPREKLEEKGPGVLSDSELLSLVLRTGIPGKNVKELSAEVLDSYRVSELADSSLGELQEFEGISRVKAGQLIALGELGRRMKRGDRDKIDSLDDVKTQVEDMKFRQEELLRVLHLNSGNKLLGEDEFPGAVDAVSFEPRKIFRSALQSNASAIILAHNHPSGVAEPTDKDTEVTEEIIEAADRLGLEVLDHVIVGETVTSMRASTAVEFP